MCIRDRTTCAVTRMEGSKAYNVLPPKAAVGTNLRLLGQDTLDSIQTYLKQTIHNPNIDVELVEGDVYKRQGYHRHRRGGTKDR